MSKLLKLLLFAPGALAVSVGIAAAQTPAPGNPPPAPVAAPGSPQEPAPAEKKPLRYEDSASVEAKTPSVPPPADTATKLEVPVRDLPVSVSVVPSRLAAEQAALVLGDALKNASGVNVGTGFGLFDFFVVRGFDSLDTGLVLVDGAPDTEATFYPLYNVQQVEVLKGPGAFAWGGGALAGTVQVVRKQPVTPRFADLTLAYGRYGTYEAAADANTASADGTLAFRLNAVAQGTDGYRDGRDGSIAALNPTFAWRPDERTRLALSYEYLSNRQSPDSGLPFVNSASADVDRRTSYQSGSDFSEQDAQRARFDAERRLNDTFVLRDKLYWAALDWQPTARSCWVRSRSRRPDLRPAHAGPARRPPAPLRQPARAGRHVRDGKRGPRARHRLRGEPPARQLHADRVAASAARPPQPGRSRGRHLPNPPPAGEPGRRLDEPGDSAVRHRPRDVLAEAAARRRSPLRQRRLRGRAHRGTVRDASKLSPLAGWSSSPCPTCRSTRAAASALPRRRSRSSGRASPRRASSSREA